MKRLAYLLLLALVMAVPALAEGSWEGSWKIAWPDGGGVLALTQEGPKVSGGYRSGHGSVEAVADGRQLKGKLIQRGSSVSFTAMLTADGTGFSGRTETGNWLSGVRVAEAEAKADPLAIDLSNPRAALRSFLDASNLARDGEQKAFDWAVETIDFGNDPHWLDVEARYSGAEDLFEAIDLATFSFSLIPEQPASPSLQISLPRLDSTATVNVAFARGEDGKWRLVMPGAEALRAMSGGTLRPADSYRLLQSPRDTMRAFLEGMAHWREGGDAEAISAIDLSYVTEVLKPLEGQLLAQYIIRILDRVGYMPLQSIPNSGASREPFVLFEHPEGRIVIAPIGTGEATRWQFITSGAQSLRRLHRAVDTLPEAHMLDSRLVPWSPTFWLRDRFKSYAPALLADTPGGRLEYWQMMAGLLAVLTLLGAAMIFQKAVGWLLRRPAIAPHVTNSNRIAGALGLGLAAAIASQVLPMVGLPASMRQFSLPVVGSIIIIVLVYAGWKVIMAISSILQRYTERTETPLDNILLTFSAGISRVVLLTAAGFSLGHLWSLPTTGLIAGLGVGGLAVAFASKETLANLLGASVLLGDRPFRTGDRIAAGDIRGWVEEVGLRSTRVRTMDDTIMIVPNGKLADMTITNTGSTRRSLSTVLTITGGSTPQKVRAFIDGIRDRIASDSAFLPQSIEVHISGITAASIQVELFANFSTRDRMTGLDAAHELFLDILKLAEGQGLSLGMATEKLPAFYLKQA